MSAYDPKRTLAFLGHLVLYEPNDRCNDRPSDAAANCLTEESTNIHAAGCIAQNRQKRGEDLTSDAASDCARDGVARRAKAHILHTAPTALPPSAPPTIWSIILMSAPPLRCRETGPRKMIGSQSRGVRPPPTTTITTRFHSPVGPRWRQYHQLRSTIQSFTSSRNCR